MSNTSSLFNLSSKELKGFILEYRTACNTRRFGYLPSHSLILGTYAKYNGKGADGVLLLRNGKGCEVEHKNWSKGHYRSWILKNAVKRFSYPYGCRILVVNDDKYLHFYRFRHDLSQYGIKLMSYSQFLWYAYEHGILGKRSGKPTNFVSLSNPKLSNPTNLVGVLNLKRIVSSLGGSVPEHGCMVSNVGVRSVTLKPDDAVCGDYRHQLRERCKPTNYFVNRVVKKIVNRGLADVSKCEVGVVDGVTDGLTLKSDGVLKRFLCFVSKRILFYFRVMLK